MHVHCKSEIHEQGGDRCLHLWPSIRIKVFIHLCVNKLGEFLSLQRPSVHCARVKIAQNNWVNKFESNERRRMRVTWTVGTLCMQWKK